MTDDQRSKLHAFALGETPGLEFERWFLAQHALEGQLGKDLHWKLTSYDYKDRDEVWELRQLLAAKLETIRQCECPVIRTVVPMSSDLYFEKVFGSMERVIEYGPEKWWLYISRCKACGTNWLIAQDDRIYDDFFLTLISDADVVEARSGRWPDQFQTYEAVLALGRQTRNPPRFFDPMAASLIWTVEDLLKERPSIRVEEIAELLGLSNEHAAKLVRKARARTGFAIFRWFSKKCVGR